MPSSPASLPEHLSNCHPADAWPRPPPTSLLLAAPASAQKSLSDLLAREHLHVQAVQAVPQVSRQSVPE